MTGMAVGAGTWKLGHRRGLDQLRAVAVLLVVVGHSFRNSGVGWAGGVGVTVFFVLSGFLITRLLLEEKGRGGVDLGSFWGRRARRLLPALPLALVACAVATQIAGGAILRPMVGAVTYSSNYTQLGIDAGAFRHLWSLAVEEHFYLLWPAVVAFVPRRVLLPASLAGIAVVTGARAMTVDYWTQYQATHLRIDALLIGAVLAMVIDRLPKLSPVTVAGAVAVIGVLSVGGSQPLAWSLTVGALASGVLVVAALDVTRVRPWLEHIGAISYGLYLFHYPIVTVAHHYIGDDTDLAVFVVTLAGSLAAAEVSMRLIESRFTRRRSGERQLPDPVGGRGDQVHRQQPHDPVDSEARRIEVGAAVAVRDVLVVELVPGPGLRPVVGHE